MFKLIGLLKRRPGMSPDDFVQYYEGTHRKIGEKYLAGRAIRYLRRFLSPLADPIAGTLPEPDFDVVMEIWFPDKDAFESTMAMLATPDIAAEIAEDEERLFDRTRNRFFIVDERESQLPLPASVS